MCVRPRKSAIYVKNDTVTITDLYNAKGGYITDRFECASLGDCTKGTPGAEGVATVSTAHPLPVPQPHRPEVGQGRVPGRRSPPPWSGSSNWSVDWTPLHTIRLGTSGFTEPIRTDSIKNPRDTAVTLRRTYICKRFEEAAQLVWMIN